MSSNDEKKHTQKSQEQMTTKPPTSGFHIDPSDLEKVAKARMQDKAIAKGLITKEQAEEQAKRPPRPGALRMASEVEFHTQLGVALFYGRKANPQRRIAPVVGLARFAKKVAEVWRAAGEDDPFADFVLLEIEACYDKADERLNRVLKDVELAVKTDIDMDMPDEFMVSKKPTRLKTQFVCPWAWRGLKLLIKYDKLVRLALAGRHIGLYTSEDWDAIVYESARGIRHMFLQADKWLYTGIGRENFKQKDDYARKAEETYEKKNRKACLEIDEDVMTGTRRAKLSPEIKGNPREERYRALRKLIKKADAEEIKVINEDIKINGGIKKMKDNVENKSNKRLKLKSSGKKES